MAAVGAAPFLPALTPGNARAAAADRPEFPLVADGTAVPVFVDAADDPAVVRAAGDLQADVERVSGARPELLHTLPRSVPLLVLVGTLGASPAIDRLVRRGRLDVSRVKGRWEASVTRVVERPFPGVGRALVIAGSDRRGTVYGIYDTSERIGVSPWYWWADVPVEHRDTVTVPAGPFTRQEPSVRYRGVFINDEQNMTTWSHRTQEPDKNIGPETYKRVFELLLRLKANYLWPAMHPYSDFFNKYRENPELADRYGIVVGSSHPEALLRNGVHEWEPWIAEHPNPDGTAPVYDYTVNPAVISDYWRARARQNAAYESSWTLGMRGLHDSALETKYATTIPEKVVVMNDIIADQRRILAEEVGAAAEPQIFIPYKEVLDLYNAGVQVPDDVTLIWPDDNHGNMRQLPNDAERARPGGNGIYYHLSYWGRPKSYLWLDTTQVAKVWQELRRVYEHGTDRMWIFNVGDLKSIETGLSFAMDMAWEVDRWESGEVEGFLAEWYGRQFGRRHAREIASIRTEYYRLAGELRPEFIAAGLVSVVHHGDEAGRRMAAYERLLARVRAVGAEVPETYRDAFYELVEYPVHGAWLMNLKYYWADRNALAVRQGRGAGANRFADLALAAHSAEAALTTRYNTQVAGGKWDGFVNPYPSQIPKAPGRPAVTRVARQETSGLGVAAEGNETGAGRPLSFSSYTRDRRFVDVFNTGFLPVDWAAEASHPWVVLSTAGGSLTEQRRVWVEIDWDRTPEGAQEATVVLTGAGQRYEVPLRVVNGPRRARGFAEAHGCVSIDASHADRRVARAGCRWRTVGGLGRRTGAVEAVPSTAAPITADFASRAPELRYRVRFSSTGTFPVTLFRLPSLDERGRRRVAVGLDDQPVTVLSGQAVATGNRGDAWARQVEDGVERLTATVTVAEAGEHVLRVFMVDPAIAVDQIVIDTGGLPATYLAPPESFHPVFNPEPATGPVLEAPDQ
ncbi:glycosyl hydrolase 115 family protein [Streptomyces griseorubiginosus]|uniref:glycosyl hydrolase 115 family protein n=1 Tax=Streptomyces griseorubiginosus TaxID=67304 RepID=UPI002E80C0C4|nr:glycosyl hydrolase 115 family protein [Streptomyces griseorubiginosus]WUB50168.1 glycosyl hydrolase 115 family protein [Streptomyces griseorubiginosus]WUB58694.1 glycosyl hydrolase 115 family protein [Streptomyces griseorubiginosus]